MTQFSKIYSSKKKVCHGIKKCIMISNSDPKTVLEMPYDSTNIQGRKIAIKETCIWYVTIKLDLRLKSLLCFYSCKNGGLMFSFVDRFHQMYNKELFILPLNFTLFLSLTRYIRSERSIILINFCLSIISSNILILVGQTQTHNKVWLLTILFVCVCLCIGDEKKISDEGKSYWNWRRIKKDKQKRKEGKYVQAGKENGKRESEGKR